jgi:excisionase family DNA binding protein
MSRRRGESAPPPPPQADLVADGFASLREAEQFLSLSKAKLYNLMETGQLVFAKFGKSRRIPRAALRAYAQKCLLGHSA